jgi:hypothetical protein
MYFASKRLVRGTLLAAGLLASISSTGIADDLGDLKTEIDQLQETMRQSQAAHEQHIKALEQRIRGLEDQATQQANSQPTSPSESSGYSQSDILGPTTGGTGLNIGADIMFAGGGSSVGDDEIGELQAGGHDPKVNGFTFQNLELVVGGAVDPYFDAQANLIFLIDQDGETIVELEEAFATTRSLPAGLQVKAGQYYTEFGRQNTQHPHAWDFVDQPVIMSRLLGPDGLRSQGARIAWLSPLPWFSEFTLGAQNANGETVTSFLANPGASVGGAEFLDSGSHNISDLLYSARWLNGFDMSDTTSVNWGISGLFGPNATGADTSTYIAGTDLYLKWQPAQTVRGFPFVSWQTEVMLREFEAAFADGSAQDLTDWGFYTQGLWGFEPGWIAGLRVDHANSNGISRDDPLRDTRWRVSPNLAWYPTEFTRLRLQYNHDWTEFLTDGSADTVWLQLGVSLGSHFAHTF